MNYERAARRAARRLQFPCSGFNHSVTAALITDRLLRQLASIAQTMAASGKLLIIGGLVPLLQTTAVAQHHEAGSTVEAVGRMSETAPGDQQEEAHPQTQPWEKNKPIIIKPDLMLRGAGENVDTIGVWETTKPEDTLIFVSAKENQTVEIWKFPFKGSEQSPMKKPEWKDGSVNGIAIDQDEDRLYVTVGLEPSSAFVYSLSNLEQKLRFVNKSRDLFSEPNVCLLHRPGKSKLAYVTSDRQISIHDAATGKQIGLFDSPTDVETIYGDEHYQCLYVPDENDRSGVNVYTPDLTPFNKNGTNHFGSGVFESDAEGVWVYYMSGHGKADDGRGYIVVSDQKEPLTEFEFFDRQTWKHLGTLNMEGVGNTDGICSSQRPLPGYPLGFFAAIHDDQALAIVRWETMLKALDLPTK